MSTTTDTIGIRPGHPTEVDDDVDFDVLRVQLGGRLVTPGDPGWDEISRPWNLAIDQAPAAVVFAHSPRDVAAAVRFGRANGLAVAPQAGGHGATSRLAGSIVVRSSGLTDLAIDPVARIARVGAGVRWGALQAKLDGTGLTGMIGSNPDVSVVGYTLQGGYSWFTRAFGMGSDSLRAAEVVDAQGEVRWVDDTSDPELMWGLRGGGGNLAYVTAVEIDLHPAPEIAGGRLMFPFVAARAVLDAYVDATASAPPSVSLWASIVHLPDVSFIPEEVRGQSFVVIEGATTDGLELLKSALAPVRAAGPVVYDTVRVRTASEVGDICEEPVDPMPALHCARPLGDLTPQTVEALLAVSGTPGVMQIQVRHVGAVRPGHRPGFVTAVRSEFLVTSLALVPDPSMEPMIVKGFETVSEALLPWTEGAVGSTLLAPWDSLDRSASYGELERLRELVAREDPTGVFRAATGLS
ncbi:MULTISPECIES: FAD-binding oxidoreductase [Mumia]|uniref:FAD-binding oxidoreductase n=1 Tax=Mumia TaxID=1546255 RepID=UPI00141EC620|nr:FAD-binding oxidoreductase [Mumia sp. ZJ430]